MNKNKYLLSLVLFTVMAVNPLWAEEISYDRYAKEEPSKSREAFPDWEKHFPVYPFEGVRWPVDKTLLFIEDYHVYDKVHWIYNELKEHGVKPQLFKGGASLRDGLGAGLKLDLAKFSGLGDRYPGFVATASAFWTLDKISDYRAEIKQEPFAGTGFTAGGNFSYENRGEEHFYGIGPHTSRGDGTSYRMERTTLGATVAHPLSETWDLEGGFSFQNVNITNGEDGGRGIIDTIFVETGRQSIPGLGGDEILSWKLELKHDNRDDEDLPAQGGYEKFHFSFNKGMESNSGYFKYRGETAHFFKVFSERRVLGLRGVVEHNNEMGGREVPFFGMARLGGYGTFPRFGDTHRGYVRDRFYDESLLLFNTEYRWEVLEYRDWRVDPVLFCDVGQVFGDWGNFKLGDFRVSYGFGFRVSQAKKMLLTFEIARSNEGTEFYVNGKAPF